MKTLDEYTDAQLEAELERRRWRRNAGLCDYCERPPTDPPCRFPERHKKPHIVSPSMKHHTV